MTAKIEEEEFQILKKMMSTPLRMWCGNGRAVNNLMVNGFVKFCQPPPWNEATFFTITEEGIKLFRHYQNMRAM